MDHCELCKICYIKTERRNNKFKNLYLTIYTLYNREHICDNDWCKIINNPKHKFYKSISFYNISKFQDIQYFIIFNCITSINIYHIYK